jgi:hypothetical protein
MTLEDYFKSRREKRFNLIGFNFPERKYKWQEGYDYPTEPVYKHCLIHPGYRLFPMKEDPTMLQCPKCGSRWPEQDTISEERFNPEVTNKPQIITTKKKNKKYYDKSGNEITDPTLIVDIQRGATVYEYHEHKEGKKTSCC